MEAWIIILGVIIIIIAFFLIRYYFFSTTTLADKIHLSDSPADISLNDTLNPKSINYTFGSWVYVNNFSNAVLYSYATTESSTTSTPLKFSLILGGVNMNMPSISGVKGVLNSPVLTAIINGGTATTSSYNTVTITNNFPIQKWVYVAVAVDTIYADCYIDGKLVISKPLSPQITVAPSIPPMIKFTQPNGSKPDIWLTKLTRWDKPLDPQSVYNEYSAGNGLSQGGNLSIVLDVTTDKASNTYPIYSNK